MRNVRVSFRRVGGLNFVKVGNWTLMYCKSRRIKPIREQVSRKWEAEEALICISLIPVVMFASVCMTAGLMDYVGYEKLVQLTRFIP